MTNVYRQHKKIDQELYQDSKWLYQRYWVDGHSASKMAGEAGCNKRTILRWMRHWNILRRPLAEAISGFATQAERFWSKVDVRGDDDCWAWQASHDKNGYGKFRVGLRGSVRAQRVAWGLTYGPIPSGLLVCHHCDNPECCNPNHLFLGTNADNAADMVAKGRSARGAQNPSSKLTEEKVLKIRALYAKGSQTQQEIATKFGVSQTQISSIVGRRSWKWLRQSTN